MDNVELSYSDANGPCSVPLGQGSISIGRAPDQDIVLSDPRVSRRHALIVQEQDSYSVIDQNSTHGTFLNSVRVDKATLTLGDVLQIGSTNGPRVRVQQAQTGMVEQAAVTGLLSSLSKLSVLKDEQRPGMLEMEKLNWLLRAARQLNQSGAIEDILKSFLHQTLQLTGLERGFVFLQEEDEMKFEQGLAADGSDAIEDFTISRKAIQQAIESEVNFSVSDTLTHRAAAEWPSVIANSIRSIYCIPLRKRARSDEPSQLLGMLYLDSQVGLREFHEVDHQLLDTIAIEASALLHNALLTEAETKARQAQEELAIAAKIHNGLMAIKLPELAYAALQAKSVPCHAIGGDFYDAVAFKDSICMVIADVSGKGVSAAIVAATLQGIIHSQLQAGQSLSMIASLVNQFLCTRKVGKYATMILFKLFQDGRVEYMNCGHIQPLAVHGSEIRSLKESSLVVGLIADATYNSADYIMRPGERILLATDGLTEAEDALGQQFGDAGLSAVAHHGDLNEILDLVASFHSPKPAEDDCTLMEIRYVGPIDPTKLT
jgi:sigma-B regulation protein RsbU (phosphoserine phosphatase)